MMRISDLSVLSLKKLLCERLTFMVPQTMNPNNVVDPVTLTLVPSSVSSSNTLIYHLSAKLRVFLSTSATHSTAVP